MKPNFFADLRPLIRVFAVDSSNNLVQVCNSSFSSNNLAKRQASSSAVSFLIFLLVFFFHRLFNPFSD